MAQIHTTHGLLDEATLARTVGFEDRPLEFVIWVEWKLACHAPSCPNCDQPVVNGQHLVKRDAHVILKQPTVTADALVGGF